MVKSHFTTIIDENSNSNDTTLELGQSLLNPISAILGMTQTLQRTTLSPEQQKAYIDHIAQACTEMLNFINEFLEKNHFASGQIKESDGHYDISTELLLDGLKNITALVIDDDITRREMVIKHLQKFGLQCSASDNDAALQTLYAAQQEEKPYQIAVISASHFDHHVAYLGRTIKSNSKISQIMPVLAVGSDLPDFEKERAHFSGFACILNLTKANRFAGKLLNSWRSWSTKMQFTHTERKVTKNIILVVEDDPIPQKVTQRQLAELGYLVDTAADGHTALKYLEQKVYDMVFMDIGLPDISGLEVTAEFRKREKEQHHTPIIGLTMHALGSDQETGLQAGMDEYIVKPLLQDRLKVLIKKWITDKNNKD